MRFTLYMHRFFLLTLFTALFAGGKAQNIERYNSFSYNVNEGLLQSNVLDMAFDKNNFCWLSFANGIQKFDGKNFIMVPVQPGLPDDKWVNFFKCSDGSLLISHSLGISKYDINSNRFTQVYKTRELVKMPAIFIGEDENVIYFFTETAGMIGLSTLNWQTASETHTGLPAANSGTNYLPRVSANIINHKFAFLINSCLYLWDIKQQKIINRSPALKNIFSFFLSLASENEVLYFGNVDQSLCVYNFQHNSSSTIAKKPAESNNAFRAVVFTWGKKQLISSYNRLYETDSLRQVLKTELVNFQNKPIADNAVICKIVTDNFNNLYLVTINGGFRKIIRNNYPIKYYGSEEKKGNYITSILPDKRNNRILAGTYGNGLLVFDSLQRLVKHIQRLPGQSSSFSIPVMIKTNTGDYLLFVWGDKNCWWLSKDLTQLKAIKINSTLAESETGMGYFGSFLFQNEKMALIRSERYIYTANFIDKKIIATKLNVSPTMSGLLYNDNIVTHANDELIFFDTASFKEIKRIPFANTGAARCFAKDRANNIYIGSNKGIFKTDSTGKILWHLTKEKGLPDECIYAMIFDDEDFLWCSTNKGVFKVNRDHIILQLKKEDGLQENEFNTNAVARAEDGEIFFAGVNGVTSFFASAINSMEEKINLLFTNIKVNNEALYKDSATWNINKIDLSYDKNSLSFDFIAMANNNPGQYIYQYKMQGVDDEWMQNNELQTVHYFLPPGKYIFKIYASRGFNKDAKAMKEISIRIHPPFWKTWWFIAAVVLLMATLLVYSINRYNKRKYQKILTELESEHKVQIERERISRDLHDNIGAYANTVLYKTDLLQKNDIPAERDELMNDLKFASKDIITSLRETIWALKKDQYSAQDCLLRVRNFIQPFSRYYPHIHFSINGEAPESLQLHYTKALNLVRIVQEAVTNAIKHAGADKIKIVSSVENNKWKWIISDNGTGFDYEGIHEMQQGNGLDNMKQRAIDGNFTIEIYSAPAKGTVISIIV